MKTTIRKSITVILALLLIMLVTVFAVSCGITEEQTYEKRWLSVAEQLEMSRILNEEAVCEDEITSARESETAVDTETIDTAFETENVTKEILTSQVAEKQTEITYVLNTNSKKFHYLSCSGLPTKNRRDFYGTRDEAIEAGYEPCGRCKP